MTLIARIVRIGIYIGNNSIQWAYFSFQGISKLCFNARHGLFLSSNFGHECPTCFENRARGGEYIF